MSAFHFLVVLVCSLFVWAGGARADEKRLDVGTVDQAPASLTQYLAVLHDSNMGLTLTEVINPLMAPQFKFLEAGDQALRFGDQPTVWWLRLNLHNGTERVLDRVLEIANPHLANVQLYSVGPKQAETPIPATRSHTRQGYLFPVSLPAQSGQVYYLRLQGESSRLVPARLWTPQALQARELNHYRGQAGYFGAATALLLFILLFYAVLRRDLIYISSAALFASVAFTLAVRNGFAREFWWPGTTSLATTLSTIAFPIGLSLCAASLLFFLSHLLDVRKTTPVMDRVLKYAGILYLLYPILLVVSPPIFSAPSTILFTLACVLAIGIGVHAAVMKRQRGAYFFLAAPVVGVLGTILMDAQLRDFLFSYVLTSSALRLQTAVDLLLGSDYLASANALQLGGALFMLLLSIALIDRHDHVRKTELQARTEEIENLQQASLLLKNEVAEHTRSLEDTRLMIEALSDIGRELTACLDRDAVYKALEGYLLNPNNGSIEVQSFSLFLLDNTGTTLVRVFRAGAGKPDLVDSVPRNDPTSYVARVIRERRELIARERDEAGNSKVGVTPGLVTKEKARPSLMFAPFIVSGKALGSIVVRTATHQAYREPEKVLFRALCSYAAIALHNTSMLEALEAASERTRELLHNILPVDIATELSETGRVRPVRHEWVSVLFTDFRGFTQISATMPAERLVTELNEIFAAFDDICDELGVEKIKTIGDAFMAVAGLPKPCADHAQRCVRAGLRMAEYLDQRNRSTEFAWAVRIGVHSGPVVSGVVGKRKYSFDIWGDTVNTASRMESCGEAGRVNISGCTHDLIRSEFNGEYRGKIDAKGKGLVDMYFVTSVE